MGTPGDIAHAVSFVVSEGAGFVTGQRVPQVEEVRLLADRGLRQRVTDLGGQRIAYRSRSGSRRW